VVPVEGEDGRVDVVQGPLTDPKGNDGLFITPFVTSALPPNAELTEADEIVFPG
jgi:hypothetical protein